jgi:hypothetical protein
VLIVEGSLGELESSESEHPIKEMLPIIAIARELNFMFIWGKPKFVMIKFRAILNEPNHVIYHFAPLLKMAYSS